MQPSKETHDAILALEAKIDRYTKLLDKSLADKEDIDKTKVIFHDLKILTEELAELKTTRRQNTRHKQKGWLLTLSPGKINRPHPNRA